MHSCYNINMYRIAICEDEKVILDFESSLINEWAKGPLCQGDYQLESYPSAENFLFESPDKAPYDLLIFDIQMKNMNGMELAKKLRQNSCKSSIIFITGIPDYAIEGYEVGAVRYIIKPIKKEVLFPLLDSLYQESKKKAQNYFVLNQGSDIERISYDQILYLEAQGHYVFLKTENFDRQWTASFSQVSQELCHNRPDKVPQFFCLRRGLLVNLARISKITRTECILDNDQALPIARGMYKDLNQAFIEYFREN